MPKLNLPSPFGGKKKKTNSETSVPPALAELAMGTSNVRDIIAPEAIEVDFSDVKINDTYYRTLFVAGYPRFVNANWLSPLINFPHSLTISMFIYPVDGKGVIEDLRRKIAEMEAELAGDIQRGKIINIDTQVKLEDARSLQEQLAKGAERFFQFGLYVTIRSEKKDELDRVTNHVKSALGALLIVAKTASLQIEDGFKTTLPTGYDKLKINRNMDTTSLATTFPFTSSELTMSEGIMYGINEHNDSLVVFDRFSLENANMVVFAKSGAGKCLAYNEKVVIKQNGQVSEVKIGQYIDQLMKSSNQITKVQESEALLNPELEIVGYDSELNTKWSKVEVAARKQNPYKQLLKVTTKSGRSITVTPDHQLLVLKNGEVVTRQASETEIGEHMPIPKQIPGPSKPFTLSLLQLLAANPRIHVIGAADWLKQTNYTGQYAQKYFEGRAFPITLYHTQKSLTDSPLPSSARLQVQNSTNHTLSPIFKVTPDISWLIGLYIAEGCTSPGVVIISNINQEIRDQIISILEKNKFPHFVTPTDIRISSSLFKHIIETLNLGHNASTKQFPSWAFNLNNSCLSSMIAGYLDGDGSVETKEITAVSKSETLISSLALLLNRFNIHARIRPTQKKATNSKMAKQTYHQLTISGKDNFSNFAKNISFIHRGKQSKLKNIIKENKSIISNTNVDIIPGLPPIFKKLHELLFSPYKVSPGQNYINIKNGKYNPSSKELLKHIKTCKDRLKIVSGETAVKAKTYIESLDLLANNQVIWDPITLITPVSSKNSYVYDLQVNNQVFLAGSGGIFVHNSYMVKLEILRSLLFDTEVIIIDPEDEYRTLTEAIGGTYIDFSFSSPSRINPFELPQIKEPDENELAMKIISLHSLMKVMLGDVTSQEDALLDRALVATYSMKGITRDPSTHANEPPLMEDLYKILVGMEEAVAKGLADRLEKFVKGSFQGIFSQKSNVNFGDQLTVFGIRNLQDELRPTAIFIILDYIRTKVKRDLKKRLLIVDEAWYLMKNEDSASFLYAVAKRARKYYLGLTTITQDVEDFVKSDYGKAIVTNSSIQMLMKQSTSAADRLKDIFYLSQGEKHLLLSAEIGEGIFFAGQNHVALRVVASPAEHQLITTDPKDLLKKKEAIQAAKAAEALTKPNTPSPQGLSSTGDVAKGQVGTPKAGGESLSGSPVPTKPIEPTPTPTTPAPKAIYQVEKSPDAGATTSPKLPPPPLNPLS
mgnify:FL=1